MHMKFLGLLAVAVAALMALTATASATTATSPTGTVYTGPIKAANESGHLSFHNETANIECALSLEGTIKGHGSSTTAEAPISALAITSCTDGWTITVNAPGVLVFHTISGGPNATATWSGATWTMTSSLFGITCRYTTNSTDIGTLTGSATTGKTATLDISSNIPLHGGSIFCGESAVWTGSLLFSTPDSLNFD